MLVEIEFCMTLLENLSYREIIKINTNKLSIVCKNEHLKCILLLQINLLKILYNT